MSIFGTTFDKGVAATTFTDERWLSALIEVEQTLLTATAAVGVLPPAGLAQIRQHWAALAITVSEVAATAGEGGNPLIPLVTRLKDAVPVHLRQYVHFGATSQDIVDTAMMVLARRGVAALITDMRSAATCCAELAGRHRQDVIVGRTLMQDAQPTTFGLKAAGWMLALDGAADRLSIVRDSLPVQYGGPVGTFSGSRGKGPQIRRFLAAELELAESELAWHTRRLPVADLAGALGTVAGVVGKIAGDIVLLAQTGIAEVSEGVSGRGASSSMPHKQNPIAAISSRACALRTPALVAGLFASMNQEHERAAGAWHAEWETLADLLRLTGSAVSWLSDSVAHLQVNTEAMSAHCADLGGDTDPALAADLVDSALAARATREAMGSKQ